MNDRPLSMRQGDIKLRGLSAAFYRPNKSVAFSIYSEPLLNGADARSPAVPFVELDLDGEFLRLTRAQAVKFADTLKQMIEEHP